MIGFQSSPVARQHPHDSPAGSGGGATGRWRRWPLASLGALWKLLCCLSLPLLVAACEDRRPEPFAATDITGASFGGEIRLTDHHGRPRALADYHGKAVLLFFGYTHCPDICPTTMARFAAVSKRLGDDARRLQVVFVTLDPGRDTTEVLARYVPFFHPDFVGLTGSEAEIAEVARRYRVPFVRRDEGGGNYLIDHWAGAYAFDAAGRLRLYVPPDLADEALVADLRRLMVAG
jgi:protein SCO1/2